MSCFTRIQIKSAMSKKTNADVDVPPPQKKCVINFSSHRTAVAAGGTMNTFTVIWSMMDGVERGNAALPQDAAIRVMSRPRHGIMV